MKEFIAQYWFISGAIPLLISIVAVAHKMMDFSEKFRNRNFKRLTFLEKCATKDSQLLEFIQKVTDENIFKEVYGRVVTPNIAKAYMELYSKGIFTVFELRCAHQYMNFDDLKKPYVVLGPGATFTLWAFSTFGLFVLLYFGVLITIVLGSKEFGTAIIGVISLAIMGFLSTSMFFTEARNVLVARKIRRKLDKLYASEQPIPEGVSAS